MSADTHQKRIGIMFNFRPTALPGFRVGLPEDDEPGSSGQRGAFGRPDDTS
jgi:hypothetical protein